MSLLHTQESLVNSLRSYFAERAGAFKIQMAFLYGSWSRGYPRFDSDIDIAIVLEDDDLSEEAIFDIINALTLSLTGYLRAEVNVMTIGPEFAKPMLYYNAIILGKAVFIKDYVRYVNLINEAIYQMEDFSIFGRTWQIMVAEKNLEALQA
ncbi:MAG: nucleotidyltransferase domain-containing protein [Candidatus Tectomicrobia bacterium]|uniref:Nucleotidyltransferase domain-containing protein n=1 Tax=Tectimicrobiota bacterium TaxID=2528274 RepID=A0A933GM17_UNCTE|nr:nucleotidyltransferase domain-containing protein [Candidatus Tectomicrobia bacterium]